MNVRSNNVSYQQTKQFTKYTYLSNPLISDNVEFEIRNITLNDAGYYNSGSTLADAQSSDGVVLIVYGMYWYFIKLSSKTDKKIEKMLKKNYMLWAYYSESCLKKTTTFTRLGASKSCIMPNMETHETADLRDPRLLDIVE